MSTVKYRYPARNGEKPRAGRVTLFLLITVIVATFVAMTFGDASGARLF